MKKTFCLAFAFLAIFACDKQENQNPPKEEKGEIMLSVDNKTVSQLGETFSVLVTSNADWTLSVDNSCKWVTPSAVEGKDGDAVEFKVDANDSGEERSAEFIFTVAKTEARLKITSLATSLIEVEKTEFVLDHKAGELSINIKTEVPYPDLRITVESKENWINHNINIAGQGEYNASAKLDYTALEGLHDRSAVIKVTAAHANEVTVNVTQEALKVLDTEEKALLAPADGGELLIPVIANVDYSVLVTAEGDWITHDGNDGNDEIFIIEPFAGEKRTATVTFTQTDAKEGVEPLKLEVTVTQQLDAIIKWAAKMTGNRLFPKWEGSGIADNRALKHITYEALVYFEDFDKDPGQIMTIMGIEGKFLLRTGDIGNDIHCLQLVSGDGENTNCTLEFEAKRWYHIAATYSEKDWNVRIYIDGVEQANLESFVIFNGVSTAPEWSYEQGNTRSFWLGYSYDSSRDLHGMMTEVRIWSKALTEADLQAENHFYEVDPQSEGLEAYWKFTEGGGNTIADVTGNGNPLYGETNVRQQKDGYSNINKGDDGIEWVSIALPNK